MNVDGDPRRFADSFPRFERLLREISDTGTGLHATVVTRVNTPGARVQSIRRGLGRGTAKMPWRCAAKLPVSLAILSLQAQGLLDLDEPIASYLPSYAQWGKAEITTRHLLEHRVIWQNDPPAELLLPRSPALLETIVLGLRPVTLLEGRAQYSTNCGYAIFDALVRRLVGGSLPEYFEEAIARPMGLECLLRTSVLRDGRVARSVTSDKRTQAWLDLRAHPSMAWRVAPGDGASGSAEDYVQLLLVPISPTARRVLGLARSVELDRILLSARNTHRQLTYVNGFLVDRPHLGRALSSGSYGIDGRDAAFGFVDPVRAVAVACFFTTLLPLVRSASRNIALIYALCRDLDLQAAGSNAQ